MQHMYVTKVQFGENNSMRLGIKVPDDIEEKDRNGYAMGIVAVLRSVQGNRDREIVLHALQYNKIVEVL